jgi:hypothetical protein
MYKTFTKKNDKILLTEIKEILDNCKDEICLHMERADIMSK